MKILIFLLLVIGIFTRTYPVYTQCNPAWANQQLGTSSQTICQGGSLITAVAMALAGIGKNYNPGTLNTWLKQHNGYVNGNVLVWDALRPLWLTYEGKIPNSQIKSKLDQGKVVICNVHGGALWVLAHGYIGDNIQVNSPSYTTTSYPLNIIVDGQTAVYNVESKEEISSIFMKIQDTSQRKVEEVMKHFEIQKEIYQS